MVLSSTSEIQSLKRAKKKKQTQVFHIGPTMYYILYVI